MKKTAKNCLPVLRTLAVVAAASWFGVAHADWNSHSENALVAANHFSNFGAGGTATPIDTDKYEKVDVAPFGNGFWVAKAGVQAANDPEAAKKRAEQAHDMKNRLSVFGSSYNS